MTRGIKFEKLETLNLELILDFDVQNQLSRIRKAVTVIQQCHVRSLLPNENITSNITPNCIDAESAEYIESLLNFEITEGEFKEIRYKFKIWMCELLKWFRVSKEMESVRELLKGALGTVDYFRQLQVKYTHLIE